MKFRFLLLLCAALPIGSMFGQGTALDAVQVLPASLRSGVLKISADNGTPDPAQWYFLARTGDGEGRIQSVTVEGQEITSRKPSLDLRALLEDPVPMDFSRVKVNSTEAWKAAQDYCAGKGRILGSVSYVLQQKGQSAVPVWSVWCYGKSGTYLGMITLSAVSGEILSSE